jgi:hypothetical protein
VRFKIFTAVTILMTFFSVDSQCGLVGNVSEKCAVSISRAENGDSKLLRNIGFYVPTISHGDFTEKNIFSINFLLRKFGFETSGTD